MNTLPASAPSWPHRHGTVWIDTEFNGWGGDLISLALVDGSGREFYEVLACENPQPWVAQNVMPVLGKAPIALGWLQLQLHQWLTAYDSVHLVADWPDDIAYFCRTLITGPGERLDTPALTMEIRRDLDATSKIPHNALEDARAMRARHLQIMATAPRRVDRTGGAGWAWVVNGFAALEGAEGTSGDATAARARGEGAGGPADCAAALPPAGASDVSASGEGGNSDAGAAGVVSASGASVAAATTRPCPPAGGIQWPVSEAYVDAIAHDGGDAA